MFAGVGWAILTHTVERLDFNVGTYERFCKDMLELSEKSKAIKSQLKTEEATKTSLVLPFFTALGYDVFNGEEFVPEYSADFGIKKGEKVDYAIRRGNKVIMLVEAKHVNVDLAKHISQLFRYYSVTSAALGVLTNGISYLFFTDSHEVNIMDRHPYFKVNMDKLDNEILTKLYTYRKEMINVAMIKDFAKSETIYNNCYSMIESVSSGRISDTIIQIIKMQSGAVGIDETEIARQFSLAHRDYNEVNGSNFNMAHKESIGGAKTGYNSIIVNKSDGGGSSRSTLRDIQVHGKKIKYAVINGKRFDDISYGTLVQNIVSELATVRPKELQTAIYQKEFSSGRYDKIGIDVKRMRKPRPVDGSNVYIETHMGSSDLCKFGASLIEYCRESENFVILEVE